MALNNLAQTICYFSITLILSNVIQIITITADIPMRGTKNRMQVQTCTVPHGGGLSRRDQPHSEYHNYSRIRGKKNQMQVLRVQTCTEFDYERERERYRLQLSIVVHHLLLLCAIVLRCIVSTLICYRIVSRWLFLTKLTFRRFWPTIYLCRNFQSPSMCGFRV